MNAAISFITVIVFTFFAYKYVRINAVNQKQILGAWGIKLIFAFLYYFIFTFYLGEGVLIGDSNNFYNNGYHISQIAYDYPLEYIKLLFGIANEQSDVLLPYMDKTNIWFYGDNGDFINDNRLIIRISSLIHLISPQNIFLHIIVFAFISFSGLTLIYKAFESFLVHKKWFWFSLIVCPSIGFWGGGLLKESILIFSAGLMFYAISKLINQITLKYCLYFVLASLLLLFNKPYAGLIILPISFIWFLGRFVNWNVRYLKIIVAFIFVGFVALMFAPSKINLTEKVSYKQKDLNNLGIGGVFFINDSAFCAFDYEYINHFEMVDDSLIKVKQTTKGEYKLFGKYDFHKFQVEPSNNVYPHYLTQKPSGSYFEPKLIENSNTQLLKNIPSAIFNVLVRPFPWDNGNNLKVFSFIQNIGLLLLLIYSIVNRKKLTNQEYYILTTLIFSILFITLLIGWTTPIFGAAVRYKVPVDLLIIILSFILLKKPLKNEKV